MQLGSSHLRSVKKFFVRFPFHESLYRPLGTVYKSALPGGLGHPLTNSERLAGPGGRDRSRFAKLGRKTIRVRCKPPSNSLRFFHTGMGGGGGLNLRFKAAGILENTTSSPHKYKGVASSNCCSKKFGKTGGDRPFVSRQQGGIQLLAEGGREAPPFQRHPSAFFTVVSRKRHKLKAKLGKIRRNVGRRSQSVVLRPRRLHVLSKTFQTNSQIVPPRRIFANVDMFASPGNAQLKKFVCRWPHHQALAVNALETPLGQGFCQVYANPPWNLILRWLVRLRDNPHVTCLVAVPYWVGTVWWPLLTRLQVKGTPTVLVKPRWGMFGIV